MKYRSGISIGQAMRTGILILVMLITLPATQFSPLTAFADNGSDRITAAARSVVDWEKQHCGAEDSERLFSGSVLENAGTSPLDWFAVGISRFGFEEDYQAYLGALGERAKRLSDDDNPTEWQRVAITVAAVGGDPADIAGVDLVEKAVYGRTEENSVGRQGANGWIFALLTLDSLGYETPEGCVFDRERLLTELLSCRNDDGGFSLSGGESDVDITAMAVQALAAYQNDFTRNDIMTAVENAVDFLSLKQGEDGSLGSCESDAQAIIALCSAGVDAEDDSRFVKGGKSLLQALLAYQNEDGGFAHLYGGESDEYSSPQALCALAAVKRRQLTMRRIYDLRQELSVLQREKLDGINGRLSAIGNDTDEDSVYSAVKLFNDLTCDERTYVKYGRQLSEAAEHYDIPLSDRVFTKELCSYKKGDAGCIYSIEKTEVYKGDAGFSADDRAAYEKLKKSGAGSSDCTLAAVLLEKARSDSSLEGRDGVIADLEALSKQAEELYSEITDLNGIISEKLYPVETVGKDKANRELLRSVAERIKALPETEQKKVTAAAEILSAADNGSYYLIYGAAGAAALVIAAAFVCRGRKMKKSRSKAKTAKN